jgi:hypothetical protein
MTQPKTSSYSITNLGQGGRIRFQHSSRLVISSVVVQVVVFLLDDNLNVVYGACSPPFDECVGPNCVYVCLQSFYLKHSCSERL